MTENETPGANEFLKGENIAGTPAPIKKVATVTVFIKNAIHSQRRYVVVDVEDALKGFAMQQALLEFKSSTKSIAVTEIEFESIVYEDYE